MVVAIGWIAAMKVTEYEAKGIQPLIAHSPFLSWGYNVWSVHHFTPKSNQYCDAHLNGAYDHRWFPTASAAGSLGVVFMFLTTLSFISGPAGSVSSVAMLGGGTLRYKQDAAGLTVMLPDSTDGKEAFVLKIAGLKTNPDTTTDSGNPVCECAQAQ